MWNALYFQNKMFSCFHYFASPHPPPNQRGLCLPWVLSKSINFKATPVKASLIPTVEIFLPLMKTYNTLEMLWCQLCVRECSWHFNICYSFDPHNIAVRQVASSLLHGWKVGGSDWFCIYDFPKFTQLVRGRTRNIIQGFWLHAIF